MAMYAIENFKSYFSSDDKGKKQNIASIIGDVTDEVVSFFTPDESRYKQEPAPSQQSVEYPKPPEVDFMYYKVEGDDNR